MLQRWFVSGVVTLGIAGAAPAAFASIPSEGFSMPPAAVQADKARVVQQFVGSGDVAYRVEASAWSGALVEQQKAAQAAGADKLKPVQIGYPRAIPAEAKALPLTSLGWQSLADGSKAARISVSAADAAGLRVGYRVSGPADGLEIRFAGNGRNEVYLADPATGSDTQWSPVLEGSVATLELHLKRGFDASQFDVQLDSLSHLLWAGADLGQKDVRDIGTAGSCNVDIACVSNPSSALLDIAKATAKMIFTDNGSSYLCTGTLLNSTSGANYFYTAAHCINSQAAASTLNTYWFFDAVSCNSIAIPPYQLVTGGATLVLTEGTMDVTLLQLRTSPPLGAVRAAWNATIIPTGTTLVGIHHPSGDLKKYSQGAMQGYLQGPQAYNGVARPQANKDSFISVRWSVGTTEGGSSGAGVFTFNSNGYYELRGGLEGGAASCSNTTGLDRFSRMDLLFTQLAPYLLPSAVIPATTSAQASMVEYFNPQLIFYFMTSREDEKALLDGVVDTSANHLWYRTGYWFKTDPFSSSSTSSISRYFVAGAAKAGSRGSHFYTALNSDRAAITASGLERFSANCAGLANGTFCNEGIDSYIAIPTGTGPTAACLSTQQGIYRVFRAPPKYVDDGNHRYLTNVAMYNYMVNDQGWAGEYINFCAKP